jgi:hypothetical protein
MWSNGYYCQILIKLEFSAYILQKYTNIKFNKNPSSWRRVDPDRRMDQKKQIDAFHKFKKKPKYYIIFTSSV